MDTEQIRKGISGAINRDTLEAVWIFPPHPILTNTVYFTVQFTDFVDLKTGLGEAEDLNNSRRSIEPLRRRSNAAFISLVQRQGSLMTCQTVFPSIRSERL